jgi:N-methylhydantoinase A
VLIPHNSSVFCARGLLVSDFVLRNDKTVQSLLDSGEAIERINEHTRELIATGVSAMRAEGFDDDVMDVARSGDVQFVGQVHALSMALPPRDLTEDDGAFLRDSFTEVYERTYGAGTAWPGAPVQMLNSSVTVTGRLPRPPMAPRALEPRAPDELLRGEREVYLPSERVRAAVPIYDEARFTPGSVVTGPAVVEAVDTTLLLPSDAVARRDEYMNLIVTREEG